MDRWQHLYTKDYSKKVISGIVLGESSSSFALATTFDNEVFGFVINAVNYSCQNHGTRCIDI